MFKSKLLPLNGAILPNIKNFVNKIGKWFDNTPLVLEQNNNTTKTVNAYIVYCLDKWPGIRVRKFGATNIRKNNDKVCMCIAAME